MVLYDNNALAHSDLSAMRPVHWNATLTGSATWQGWPPENIQKYIHELPHPADPASV